MSLPIETERLRIRKYEDRDAEDILEYSSDTDFWLARNLDWPVSKEGVREYWEAQREIDVGADPKWCSLLIELKVDRKVVGHVGINVEKTGEYRQGMIGFLLGRKFHGQGIATEAAGALMDYGFEHLRLHRIAARTGRDNVRSWRLMERLGTRQEAHFRESHIVKDEWRDEFIYAILAEEWRKKQGRAKK